MTGESNIRVLMVDSERTWRGGEGQLLLLMKGLLAAGVDVALAAPARSAIAARAEAIGVACFPLSIAGGLDFGAAWKLHSYVRGGAFDIVHCHSSHAHTAAFLAVKAAGIGGVPGGVKAALVVSRRVDFPVATNRFSAMKYRWGADAFIAISNGVGRVLREGGVDEERITLVPSGIDLDKFKTRPECTYLYKEFDVGDNTPIIGNVAALAPHKSQKDLVRAACIVREQVPGARFFIVGEGELRDDLERLIDSNELQNTVTLTGFRTDVLAFFSMFDCFVLSSYLEGLCTSIMDAHAAGVPVVATDTGGVPDIVEDGVTGLLVMPGRPDLLASAIVRMLRDFDLRTACADAARTQAGSYDYRHMVEGTMDVYRQLLVAREMTQNHGTGA